MKHKLEVFGRFKQQKKEVENRLQCISHVKKTPQNGLPQGREKTLLECTKFYEIERQL